jgi:Right handed beta helix region
MNTTALTRKELMLRGLAGAAAAGIAGPARVGRAEASVSQPATHLGAFEAGEAPATAAMTFGTALPRRIKQSAGATRVIDSANGSDSNRGTDAAPWRTLQKAFSSLGRGETALVKTGTYTGRIDVTGSASGTGSTPKTLAAYPGHTPIFTGLIRPNGLQYWRFRGLTFAPIGLDTGFYAVGSTAHLDFEQVTFRDCRLGSGMVTEQTCSDLQWWRCTFLNNGRRNTILDHGLYLKSSSCVVADCLFARNSSYGLQMYPSAADNFVVNNTIVENGIRSSNPQWSGGLVIAGPTTGGNQVLNNVIAFNTGYGARSNAEVQAGNVFRRNLVWGNSLGRVAGTKWDIAGRVTETETIRADPKFIDRANGNYRLSAGSPCDRHHSPRVRADDRLPRTSPGRKRAPGPSG